MRGRLHMIWWQEGFRASVQDLQLLGRLAHLLMTVPMQSA